MPVKNVKLANMKISHEVKTSENSEYFFLENEIIHVIFNEFHKSLFLFDDTQLFIMLCTFLGSYNCACGGGYLPDSDNRKKCRKIENYDDSSSHYSSYDSYLASESLSDNSTIVRRYMDRQSEMLTGIFIERCAPGFLL